MSRKKKHKRQNTKVRKKTIKSPGKISCRASKTTCRALIPLNTEKIRKDLLKVYKRRKKVLEKIEIQLEQYNEKDEPEFQKFIARRFGAEQTRLRELAEQISLAQSRREKLRYMAREEGMSQGNYCAYLESKVTPETDFWAVLENEILEMQEEQCRLDEEFEQYCRECDEADGITEEDDDYDDDDEEEIFFENDEFEDEFAGFADEIEDMFGKEAKSIFDRLFGDVLSAKESHPRNDDKALKKLYRELCLRYHPDKIGEHDAKTRRLWFSIQEAYQVGDLSRLRAIHAGIKIESGNTELFCFEIDAMLGDIEWSIHMTRNQLRMKKSAPHWGFAAWTEKQRQKAERELAESYQYELAMAEQQLRKKEVELERIRNSFRSKKKKLKFDPELQPDLFEFEVPF
ncbi:MAG: J domain-containing protein [Victivallaceae bacterium]|nr:J domain-containing protein [Victivallaceae bacterium]